MRVCACACACLPERVGPERHDAQVVRVGRRERVAQRVCNILKYMQQVVADDGHTNAGEAETASVAGESAIEPVCDAIRTLFNGS